MKKLEARCPLLILAAAIIAGYAIIGCTLAPKPVQTAQASFDGNEQNSGVISVDPAKGFLCTPHFLSRYDGMLGVNGAKLTPPFKPGDRTGITPEGANWRFDAQAMSRFATLNQFRKNDGSP